MILRKSDSFRKTNILFGTREESAVRPSVFFVFFSFFHFFQFFFSHFFLNIRNSQKEEKIMNHLRSKPTCPSF